MQRVRGKVRTLELTDFKTKAATDGSLIITGLANTPNIDRMKEIVEWNAFSATLPIYMKNPIMLLQHDPRQPIGTFTEVLATQQGLRVNGVVVSGTPAADEAQVLIKHGVLRSFSIGFRELDGGYDENDIYHITSGELYEISVVSIPANRESIFTMEGGITKAVRYSGDTRASMTQNARSARLSLGRCAGRRRTARCCRRARFSSASSRRDLRLDRAAESRAHTSFFMVRGACPKRGNIKDLTQHAVLRTHRRQGRSDGLPHGTAYHRDRSEPSAWVASLRGDPRLPRAAVSRNGSPAGSAPPPLTRPGQRA